MATSKKTNTLPVRFKQKGFTIVELLIVVVVIAVLAAITIVSYGNIVNRSVDAVVRSNLATVKKKILLFSIQQGTTVYPGDLNTISLPNTSSVYRYAANNNSSPVGFCLDATQQGITYYVTDITDATPGQCDQSYGIAGWWKLNNGFTDLAKAWAMSSSGSPTYTTGQNGTANGALNLNGSTQSVYTTSFNTGSLSYGAVSLSGWVYPPNNPASDQGYFGLRAASDPQYYVLQKAGTNNLECRVWPTSAAGYTDAGTVSVTPNTWNFIVLIFNGSTAQCFVNGVGGSQTAVTGTYNFGLNTFSIGRLAGTNYFGGRVDDVRTYTRVLSSDEINSMYSEGAQ